jgi:hypothetical protein
MCRLSGLKHIAQFNQSEEAQFHIDKIIRNPPLG